MTLSKEIDVILDKRLAKRSKERAEKCTHRRVGQVGFAKKCLDCGANLNTLAEELQAIEYMKSMGKGLQD